MVKAPIIRLIILYIPIFGILYFIFSLKNNSTVGFNVSPEFIRMVFIILGMISWCCIQGYSIYKIMDFFNFFK